MSKYRHIREALQDAYPLYNPKLTEQIMKRIEKIRDAEKKKQSS